MKLLRFTYFTFVYCFFLPLFFIKNRGVNRIKGRIGSRILFRSKHAGSRLRRYTKQKRFLRAWEFFWSQWNPVVTEETTQPLYELCGGNRRPFFATMVTFLYSGIILHGFWMGPTLLCTYKVLSGDVYYPAKIFPWIATILYSSFGLPIMLSKWRRHQRMKRR